MVLAAWYMERQEKKRRRERAELQSKWEEWNLRRETAAAANEEFTEPPPSMNDKGEIS